MFSLADDHTEFSFWWKKTKHMEKKNKKQNYQDSSITLDDRQTQTANGWEERSDQSKQKWHESSWAVCFYLSGLLTADYAFNVLLSCADVRRIMKHQMQHKIKDT